MDKNIRIHESRSGKSIHVGDYVTVRVHKTDRIFYQKDEVNINWSCIGAVSIEKAEKFCKELRQAITLAKKEVK